MQSNFVTKSGLPVKKIIEFDPIRQTIAERMTGSLHDTAQLTLMSEIIVDGLIE